MMKKQHEKLMTDLQRLLQAQNFKSEEELNQFLKSLSGQQIPSFPKEALNAQEQAQDLVHAAYELPPTKAKANIKKALKLDPDCIEAYEFLGLMENDAALSITFFEKGIEIGRRIFGGEYLEEHKGMFWGFHETRPFMRCMYNYADCLYAMGKIEACVAILEEMIELNPNDNQGVRDRLMLYLVQLNESQKFLKYLKMYEEDIRTFQVFTRALFAFSTQGETEESNQLLTEAINTNKFVAKRLLSNKAVKNIPDYYGWGDANEADCYVSLAQSVWAQIKGAREWLKTHTAKS